MTNKGDRVVAWLHLEDREEYGDCYNDGTPIEYTREVWKRVTIGPVPYGPESPSRSVPITEKEAEEFLKETDLAGALYKKLGVTSLDAFPGLPKGPYYDPVNQSSILSALHEALQKESSK